MILIKGFTGKAVIEQAFDDNMSKEAFIYYKELTAQGIAVQYTNMKDKTLEEYLDSIKVKLTDLYK